MSGTPPAAGGGGGGAAAVAAAAADHFCLRWNNYQTNMTAVFDQLLQEEVFVDVTLSCEGGQQLRAHKVVLAACSPYFQAVLQNNPCKHPIVILPRDVAFADLRAIIEFVYRGEIDVAQEQINSLLAAADTLKIKGCVRLGTTQPTYPRGSQPRPPRHDTPPHLRPPRRTRPGVDRPTPADASNTSYRPRGRPPLYGRHRYDRPARTPLPPQQPPHVAQITKTILVQARESRWRVVRKTATVPQVKTVIQHSKDLTIPTTSTTPNPVLPSPLLLTFALIRCYHT
ncbi:hypothetical protein Pmani_036334 [Petrolisthes manimaculis]|uniref:BTB domain-containing protein n=1 Tax=Petrolisthes manimaculis TaxID=1843537 RepID=A0AAE1TPH7_9EUCA|nr:hypothetical protein Pmani_036334 [Petrolisthes manimaculis]